MGLGEGQAPVAGQARVMGKNTKNKLFPDLKNYSLCIFFLPSTRKIHNSANLPVAI